MTNSTLIRKVYLNCPICDKSHEVEERQRIAKIIIKDDEIEYKEEYYYCPNVTDDEENEFELPYMTNENLLAARNAYRIKHGLLTSNDIVEIRENYDLSQVEFARLMGWGEATISRYESKAMIPCCVLLRIVLWKQWKCWKRIRINSREQELIRFETE
jgi:putative zinc finger/helix-turn-helix YgiT family protein